MSSQQLRIQMVGAGPYGFRLLGGDKDPLSVSKIRPSSKAQVSGLLEGDVIMAMNDVSCQGLNHSTATGLMESSSSGLTLLVLRGRNAISDAPTVMSSLGSSVRRLNAEETNSLSQRHNNHVQTSCIDYDETNGFTTSEGTSEGTFRLSAPPSGESLKQIRVSRRESRSEEQQTPRIVVEATAGSPNYYTREERTSTDGGKTTRIVEEVKTEKFGGTTLTKVTKQEFTSYSDSTPGMPIISIVRSEDQGRPVGLGAPSFEGGIPVQNGGHFKDEQGWTITSNVERRTVKTQPAEGHVNVIREPLGSFVIYQEGADQDNWSRQEQVRNQSIPAIEIHFEPDETGFVTASASSAHPASNPDSNFQIRTGNEVSYQPKVQVHSSWSSEFQPDANTQIHQKPRIEVERKVFSNQSANQHNSYTVDSQPSRTEIHYSAPLNQSQINRVSDNTGLRYSQQSTSAFDSSQQYDPVLNQSQANRVSDNPGFRHSQQSTSAYESSQQHDPYQPTNRQEPLAVSNSYSREYPPQYHLQSDFAENPKTRYEVPSRSTQNFVHEREICPKELDRNSINQQYGYYPDDNTGYTAIVHGPKELSRSETSKTRFVDTFNHNTGVQQSLEHLGYSQETPPKEVSRSEIGKTRFGNTINHNTGVHQAVEQHGYSQEPQEPAGYLKAEPRLKPQLHNDRGTRLPFEQEPEEHHHPVYSTGNQYRPLSVQEKYGTFPRSSNLSHSRQVVPAYVDSNPIVPQQLPSAKNAQKQVAPWNYQAPDEDSEAAAIAPKQLGDYGSNEPSRNVYPGSVGRSNIRQPDRTQRVEFGATPKWIPGSKLPTKQTIQTRDSEVPSVGDFRSNPDSQRGQPGEDRSGFRVASEDGWYEAGVATDIRNLPSVALSRTYDPRTSGGASGYNTSDRFHEEEGAYDRNHEPSEWSLRGQSFGQSDPVTTGHHQGAKNVWQPSRDPPGSNYSRHFDANTDEDWSRPQDLNDTQMQSGPRADFRYQPEVAAGPPPPPAPPFMPGLMSGPPPKVPPMFSQPQEPRGPPPPAAPPLDPMKIYRGNASSDRGYGLTSLEERVKVAKTMAHSVLAPENQNSRGQKMFLRRRENSDKWTTQGPDPVPEKPPQRPPPGPAQNPSNSWAPRVTEHPRPAFTTRQSSVPPPSSFPDRHQGRLTDRAPSPASSSYSLADDVALNSGRGGQLFAKRRAKSEKWTSYESPDRQPAAHGGYDGEGFDGKKYGVNESFAADQRVDLPGVSSVGQSSSFGVKGYQQLSISGEPASYSQGPRSSGFASDSSQSYRPVKFSSNAPAPSYRQPSLNQPTKFAPKQLGFKAQVAKSVGFTDL